MLIWKVTNKGLAGCPRGRLEKRKDNLPERMTTLTSFSSLEISELEVKGLILSLFVLTFVITAMGIVVGKFT